MAIPVSRIISATAVVVATLLLLHRLPPLLSRLATSKKKEGKRYLTYRISNIPRSVNKNELYNTFVDISGHVASPENASVPAQVLGWSCAPSPAASLSQRFQVATVTLGILITASKLEMELKRRLGPDASRLKVDADFFGLTPLSDPGDDATVDIIAVSGLAGHAFGSWKSRAKHDMWLRDFLPETIPKSRIFIYGYHTKLPGSLSDASILELARRLLEIVKSIRKSTQNRPIIFIGHSLGGLVIKQALVYASEGNVDDRAVFISCYALILFGVPNRGIENVSLMTMVKGQPNEELVRSLSGSSPFLGLLQKMFLERFNLRDSRIICVFETCTTPTVQWSKELGTWERTGPNVMMVPRTSAIHAGPNEKDHDHLSIDANHSDIVKFSDQSDPDYIIIQGRLENLASRAPDVIRRRLAKQDEKLERVQTKYIQKLKAPDYIWFRRFRIDEPTPGTLSSFLQRPTFQQWMTSENSSTLWIKGSAGQGKTILAKFILRHLETSRRPTEETEVIYFFFYNQHDHLRTISAALRALIKQLLLRPRTFEEISTTLDIDATEVSDDDLWVILEDLLRKSTGKTIFFVLDALDECVDEASRQRLLALLERYGNPNRTSETSVIKLKTLLTSRPKVVLTRQLGHYSSIHLKANPQDLELFIKNQVVALNLPINLRDLAIGLLLQRAEQTFIWVSIVLKRLKSVSTLLSEAEIERIIDESPSDLKQLYAEVVDQIMDGGDVAQQKLLTWVVFAKQPLTLAELQDAIAIQNDCSTLKSTMRHRIDLTEENITSAAGVILEIKEDRLYLIHQSAKEFLLNSSHLASAAWCDMLRPNLYLAKVCMQYLLIADFAQAVSHGGAHIHELSERHAFLMYASRNWYRHIRSEDSIGILSDFIRRLTELSSSTLSIWGTLSGNPDLTSAKTIEDIAMKANIPWLAEFYIRDKLVGVDTIESLIKTGISGYNSIKALARNPDVRFTKEAICETTRLLDQAILQIFIDRGDCSDIMPELLESAVQNERNGLFLMQSLLENQAEIRITPRLVQEASSTSTGVDMINMILSQEATIISKSTLALIAQWLPHESLQHALRAQNEMTVDEGVVCAAMMDNDHGMNEKLVHLLQHWGPEFPVSEQFLIQVLPRCNWNLPRPLFMNCGNNIQVKEPIVIAAAANDGALWLIRAIYEYSPDFRSRPVTEAAAIAIVGSQDGEHILEFLIGKNLFNTAAITENIVAATARNAIHGAATLDYINNIAPTKVRATPKILEAAVSSHTEWEFPHPWTHALNVILACHGPGAEITEDVLVAAVKNTGTLGPAVTIKALVEYNRFSLQITDNILIAAANNMSRHAPSTFIFDLLLQCDISDLKITEDVLMALIPNPKYSYLLRKIDQCSLPYGEKLHLHITTNVLLLAAEHRGRRALNLIEQLFKHPIQYDEDMESRIRDGVKDEAIRNYILEQLKQRLYHVAWNPR